MSYSCTNLSRATSRSRFPFTFNQFTTTNIIEQDGQFSATVENAKEYIHLEYFIIKESEIGNKIKDVLPWLNDNETIKRLVKL